MQRVFARAGVQQLASSVMADGGTLALLGYTNSNAGTGLLEHVARTLVPDAPEGRVRTFEAFNGAADSGTRG